MTSPNYWKLLEARTATQPDRAPAVAVANQKGGVGKTTVVVNLGAALALRGHRVLVVDLDPQCNATTGMGIDRRSAPRSSYDLLVGRARIEEATMETTIERLGCVAGSVDLAGAEVELVDEPEREGRLKRALAPALSRYDIVLVDCPPSLGLLTLNALAAAQDVLTPVQCEYYALEGLGQLLDNAERVRRGFNPELRMGGLVLTMYDARTTLSSQVAGEVRRHFGDLVYESVIPRSVRVSEAPSFGEPVLTLAPLSRASIAFRLLAGEVAARYGLGPPATGSGIPSGAGADPVAVDASVLARGPAGRGYGAVAVEPPGLVESWPRLEPWTGEAPVSGPVRDGTDSSGGRPQ